MRVYVTCIINFNIIQRANAKPNESKIDFK